MRKPEIHSPCKASRTLAFKVPAVRGIVHAVLTAGLPKIAI